MSGKKSNQAAKKIYRQLEMYQLIFDSIYNGAIVTDSDGYVTHLNKPYGRFLGSVSHIDNQYSIKNCKPKQRSIRSASL